MLRDCTRRGQAVEAGGRPTATRCEHSVVTRQPRRSLFGRVRTWKPATSEAVRRSCIAVTEDRLVVARLLVHLGARSWMRSDDQHDTPWLVTGVTGSVDMLEVLAACRGPISTIRNRFGGTSLIPASERGHVGVTCDAWCAPISMINHVNDLGWTALLEAVILGDGSRRYQQIVTHRSSTLAPIPRSLIGKGLPRSQHAEQRGQRAVARILRDA